MCECIASVKLSTEIEVVSLLNRVNTAYDDVNTRWAEYVRNKMRKPYTTKFLFVGLFPRFVRFELPQDVIDGWINFKIKTGKFGSYAKYTEVLHPIKKLLENHLKHKNSGELIINDSVYKTLELIERGVYDLWY